ncbi:MULTISPECIES: acyltransferase family protein [Methylomicrobium]|uniref:Putative acyltransferase n=1 Tax=Methylomicrobium album BG8 TaxID=686340 RepID=H8GPA8_METAL|nr:MULTISPECIES: acyltransferase family protein [Methylomicrobium]EIC29694.1 putative acyltransferase [Methylomicrobium album BG8]
MQTIAYRPDIDGLRAIAVLSVVAYHLDIAPFSGGYVGVDMFFVISGYLITRIVYPDIRRRSFSWLGFYERRIRRLFPALFTVFLFSLAIPYFLFLPKDFQSVFQSLVAATLFASNLLFWKTAGYFDSTAELKPLLHTWSLSIEEQFYLLYPFLLVLVGRLSLQWTFAVLSGVACFSLFLSEFYLHGQSPSVFYLPHFRAWELLIGTLPAIGLLPPVRSRSAREALSYLGFGAIVYGIFAFDDQTLFPGAKALFPCLGTALAIHADARQRTFVGRLLGCKPLLAVGLISYSLYLWHWPLIVFAKYYAIRPLAGYEKLALLGVSCLAAALSWQYIERPFRGKNGLLSKKWLFGGAGLAMSSFVSVGLAGHIKQGFPDRLPEEPVKLAKASFKLQQLQGDCIDLPQDRIDNGQACRLGRASSERLDFIVWGDSHAFSMAESLHLSAERNGAAGLLYAHTSCPPLLDVERFNAYEQGCRKFNDSVKRWLQQNRHIGTVFLVARWAISAEGTRYGAEQGRPVIISPKGIQDNPEALKAGLERTLQFLTDEGFRTVFVSQVPEIGWNVPSTLARETLFGHRASHEVPTAGDYRERQRTMTRIINELSVHYPVEIADVASVLCASSQCLIERDGHSLYKDDDHLSVYGAATLSGLFNDFFRSDSLRTAR